jgi:uncharacterized protein (TIGR00369 family)
VRNIPDSDRFREPLIATGNGMSDRERTITWQDPMPTARAARKLSGLELLHGMRDGQLPPPPIMETLGYDMVEITEGRAVFSIEPAEFHYNPIGVVHGGVSATLLDTAMACAVHSALPAGSGYTTLEFKVNFVRGITVDSGRMTAEGTLVHLGRSMATAEGRLTGADGKLYAHATTTCMVFGPPTPST